MSNLWYGFAGCNGGLKMKTQALLLKPDQVPAGMLAYVCAPGTNTPETDDDGTKLPPLKLLFGGVPIRAKWYIFDPAKDGVPSGGFEYDAIRPDSQFTPVETFSADYAPVRREYAVFVDGERLKYSDYPKEFVKVAKATNEQIVSFNGLAYNHWLREYKLPDGAILVQTGDFAAEWDFAVLGCIGIPKPTTEQRANLEKLGVTFFDHAPFGRLSGMVGPMSVSFCFRDYVAVKLPTGWRIIGGNTAYCKCPFDIEILDAKGCRAAHIHQEPLQYDQRATWTGTLKLE
jgi:hypothetical protein